eukprot:GAHX01003577.1.p1 GENE.GAHX01003577.1~~GAHX01003577.1.p1  ORF type:complete len:68 (+),score=0.04 GAHX01003577.1:252-455(+)
MHVIKSCCYTVHIIYIFESSKCRLSGQFLISSLCLFSTKTFKTLENTFLLFLYLILVYNYFIKTKKC